jgi:ParB-like chromosome segregation protein Spo0J
MTSAQNIKIKINPEYEELVPKLAENDFQLLRDSIKSDNAVHTPIFVNQEGIILDGHHRWRIIQELGINNNPPAYKTTVKHFDNPLLEKKFVIDVNLKRRQLFPFQRAELIKKLES